MSHYLEWRDWSRDHFRDQMVARSASNTKCHTLIIWYHLSVVWCLEMVDSCCPSNVKSVKKFCEYRISEILLFSLFDILIFCKKNSWNCFLLLCEKVQQTNIITSLYPLLPQVIEPHQEKNKSATSPILQRESLWRLTLNMIGWSDALNSHKLQLNFESLSNKNIVKPNQDFEYKLADFSFLWPKKVKKSMLE